MEPITIDLAEYKVLKEMTYRTFGKKMKNILSAMFGNQSVPMTVKGSKREVDSFMAALVSEKKYMSAYLAHGLNDPRTMRDKAKLSNSVKKFERETGIKWPFK
jgi:putative hemolysin|tara:strand:+ start:646 stop:954 length:309 start_codon:yes stop_codon:yes gene_type:complete